MTRILGSRDVVVKNDLALHLAADGHRFITLGGVNFTGEDVDTKARAYDFAMDSRPSGKTIAWIGGGMCVGPRLFDLMDCEQVVYEIEPSLEEFCPEIVRFVPGDWRVTIRGPFDVIIYDIGGDVPRAELARFLNPGGTILPKEVL